ncbi:MAG: hypothetical protein ACXVXO_05995 [Mycobacteriaceae bacterium]
MIVNVVRSEFRKIISTKAWWALLIPAVVVSYLINLGGAAIAQLPDDETLRQLGGDFPSLLGFSLALSVGFTSLFTMCLGIIGSSGEVRHRTITTTYLTTKGRGTVLVGKMIAYAVIGFAYGIVIVVAATLGGLTAGGSSAFPPVGQFLAVALAGSVTLMLWTVMGVGLGSLVPNQVLVLVGALVTRLVVERIAGLALPRIGARSVADLLPSSASSAFTSRLASDFFTEQTPPRSRADFEDVFAGSGLSWWAGGLVFGVWVLACCVAAWWATKTRDVH